jgi:hypothetical protein
VIAALLLAGLVVWGHAVLRLTGVRLTRPERIVAGPIVGLTTGGWLLYLLASAFGALGPQAVVVALGIFTGAHVVSRFRPKPADDPIPHWFVWLGVALLLVLTAFNLFAVLGPAAGGGLAATEHVWSDTPFHSSIVTAFAYRDTFPPEYPIALGHALNYPFLVDFLSGALLRYGFDLRASFVVVNLFLHTAVFLGLALIVFRLTRSARAAVLSAVVLFLLGNIGFLAVPGDIAKADGIGDWLGNVPWSYTGDSAGIGGRERLGTGLYLANPVFIHLLPRRSAAFGMAVGVVLLLLLDTLIRERSKSAAVVVGLVAGVLPRVHAYTAIVLVIVGGFWVLRDLVVERAKAARALVAPLAVAGGIAAVIAVPELLKLREDTGQYVAFWPGWIGEPHDAFTAGSILSGVVDSVFFWAMNGGLLILLLPSAWFRASDALRRWYLPFIGVWLFGFFIRTQPWDWDNNNYFAWWQLATVVIVVPLITSWLESAHRVARVGGVLAVGALCLGGILSFTYAGEHRMGLWTGAEVQFAEDVRHATPEDAVILTSNGHTQPITALSGRQVVMGFPGWLSTRGLDWASYEQDVATMLAGNTRRMRELGVGYVVIGPWERALADEKNFELADAFGNRRRFSVVIDRMIDGQRWQLLKLRR